MNKHERYNKSNKGRARYSRYRSTPKGDTNEYRVRVNRAISRTNRRIKELESLLEAQVQKLMELVNAKEN